MAIILTQSFNGLASLYFFAFILFQMHKQPDFPFYFFFYFTEKKKQTNKHKSIKPCCGPNYSPLLTFIYLFGNKRL